MKFELIYVVPVLVIICASCAAQEVPPGFRVLGTRVPQEAEALLIPDGFTEQFPDVNDVAPAWTKDEMDRGHVIFATHYMDPVYPRSVPLREQITTELKMFCSRGEYEPVTFAIHALRDLTAVRVTVDNLKNSAGDVIGGANIDVRSVRCWPKRVWKNPPASQYTLFPWFLEKRDAIDVPGGRTRQYWLTVHVPPGSPAGTYRGMIHVKVPGTGATRLELELQVLPISLRTAPTRHGMYYHMFDEATPPPHPTYSDAYLDKDIINMREHGMNTVFVMLYPSISGSLNNGKVSYDLTPIASFVKTCLETGLGPGIWNMTVDDLLPAYRGPADLGANVRGFVDSFHARNWPTPILSFGDESDADDPWNTMDKLRMIKAAVPEALTYTTIVFPRNSEVGEPDLDIRAFSSYLDDAGAERTRKAGRQLWMYSGPAESTVKANRFYRGLWGSALKLDGIMDWVYFMLYEHDQLYNDLVNPRGGPNHRGWAVPTEDGPLPTLSWEGIREGIDDGRYLFTLQAMIEEARATTNAKLKTAARQADETISRLHAMVDAGKFGERYPLYRTCDELSVASFDEFRYQIAQHIIELQTLLE